MARTPQGLSNGALIVGSNTVFTATASTTITNFTLTGTDTNIKTAEIYINRGTSRLLEKLRIPAGVGVAVNVSSINGLTMDSGDVLTITMDKTGTNYDLSGWLIT